MPARLWNPTSTARARARLMLLRQIGQDAVPRRQLEPLDDLSQQVLEPHDGVELVAGGIEPEDDVAATAGEALEDGEEDLLFGVAGTVWLDARSEMVRRADRDAVSGQRIEERTRDGRELLVGEDLGRRGDRLAREPAAVTANPVGGARRQQVADEIGDGQRVELGLQAPVDGARERVAHAIVYEHGAANLAERGRQQRPPRLVAHGVIARAANQQIPFFEGIGEDQPLLQHPIIILASLVTGARQPATDRL